MRIFIDGRIAPLLMSSAGDGAAGGGGAAADGAAAAAAAAAAPTPITFAPDKPFTEQLPEKYRSNTAFKDIKNFDGLADSYLNAQKMIGERVALPKDGDEKGWNDFYNKMGRPESADKYAVGKRADGSDYGDADKAFHAKILPLLHKAGVTQKGLDEMRPVWDALIDEGRNAGRQAADAYGAQQIEGLKKEWGAAFDDNLNDARAAVQHFGGDALLAELNIVKDGKATGDNALVMKAFATMGKQLREDGVIKGGGGAQGGAMSPGDAKAQIDKLNKNDDFQKVYRTKGATGKDPDGKDITHDEAVARYAQLYAFAYSPQQ